MFFDSWEALGRIIIVGALAYVALIVILRVSGKRTLAKMNAFDMVITMAIGSILASTALSKSVPLVDGIVAFILMVALQYIVTWSSVRSKVLSKLIKSEPTLLFYEGQMLPDALKKERVLEEEVRAAIRASGTNQVSEVKAVILETDGSFNVLPADDVVATSAIHDVTNYPQPSPAQKTV